MKKLVLVASVLIMALALLLGGCGKSSEGDKFIGTWGDKEKTTSEVYYEFSRVSSSNNSYNVKLILIYEYNGKSIYKEDTSIGEYKDGIIKTPNRTFHIENDKLIETQHKSSYTKISNDILDAKELDGGRGFVK